MSLSVTSNTTSTGYEDIDNLNKQQNEISNQMYENQQNIINAQTQQNIAEIERNKQKLEEETTKTNKGLYADYQKQINPYGATAESLASNGLANSGVAESTRTNLYNTYQKNRTDTLNTARNLYADYNNKIAEAKQNGDIQLAQFAQEIYNQKMNNLYNNYQLLQNKEQFNYQKERDTVADKKWQDEFNYQQNRDQIADQQYQQQFDYNVSRDEVADKQWQKEFDYNQYLNDRNYNYQVGRDQVADKQYQQQFDYNVSRDQAADKKWQDEFDYNKYIDNRNYDYQVSRDNIADQQYREQFDYNKAVDDRNYNYQVQRDQVADKQWQQEYNLSKKKASSSGSGSYSVKQTLGNNNTMSENALNWYNSLLSIEQSKNRQTPLEELEIGLSSAMQQGVLTEQDVDAILKMKGY